MLLLLLEKKCELNEVIFYDTGMEFNAIYDIRDRVKALLKELNIKYTELKPTEDFLYKMVEKPVRKRNGKTQHGYGLCGGRCRWGTTDKNRTIEKYLKEQYGQDYKEYIRNCNRRNSKNRKRKK